MSYWIEGRVEVTHSAKDEEEIIWLNVIDIGTLIDGPDDVSEQLFGLSKWCSNNKYEGRSLFSLRGVPADSSSETKQQTDLVKEYEHTGQAGRCTFAFWHEIKTAKLPEELLQESNWRLVFQMVEQMEASGRYADEQIRIVVWFIW